MCGEEPEDKGKRVIPIIGHIMPKLKNGHIPKILATEYASFRDQVLDFMVSRLSDAEQSLSRPLVLYDPLAGTAPLLSYAERLGYTAYFNDINSLHLYVNAAKSLTSYTTFRKIGPRKLLSIVCKMVQGLDRYKRTPTDRWIEESVLKKMVLAWKRSEEQNVEMSTLTKAILLLTVRDFSSFVRTKNPTWLKPGGLRRNISTEQAFSSAIERLNLFYQQAYAKYSEIRGGHIKLTDYDASKFTPNCKVDVIMTSPPFCNRVDWDRIYAPEHFFLDAVGVWHAKTDFHGTTAVHKYTQFDSEFTFVTERSEYLKRLLKEIRTRQRPKEQRSDYYVKYFTRYFACLFRVFEIAANTLRKGGKGIYFVVQDNNHRGLQIQIDQALVEFLSTKDFQAYPVKEWDRHHLGLQNISRKYRMVTPKQRECIWHAVL